MNIVVFTGAGISAESGLQTFRATDGLWEGHKIEDVAHPNGWRKNPQLVLDFYNQRRRNVKEASPNEAHLALAQLESKHNVTIITQNIDDLHERAGSTNVLHLHGEIFQASSVNGVIEWREDLNLGDTDSDNNQLRPNIVWFEESINNWVESLEALDQADIFIVIGTSGQVFPAAGLISISRALQKIFVDPNADITLEQQGYQVVKKTAVEAVPDIVKNILASF